MSPTENPVIKSGIVVGLTYTLKNDKGQLIESRTEGDPLFYIHGHNQLLPAVEATLSGKKIGDIAQITVPPTAGYGEYRSSLVADVGRDAFPKDLDLKVGMRFDTEGPKGESLIVQVIRIEADKVTIDGNHPLAGVTLAFDMKVISLRAATEEEISHGHVHGPGGHVH